MKTPREILLDQYRGVDPALERIQAQVLANCLQGAPQQNPNRTKSSPKLMVVLRTLWTKLIKPAQTTWAGFALLWIAIIGVSLADSDHQPKSVESKSASVQQLILWKKQQALLTELMAPSSMQAPDRPKPAVPQPRSKNETTYLIG